MSKYKKGQKLFNVSKERHYKEFGDLLILGREDIDEKTIEYKVDCFGKEKPVYGLNEKELDYHFSTSNPEEKESSFKELFDSLCEMVETKDKRYGNAALKPLDIFAKHHNYGARLDEKLARVKNSEELRKNDVADLIGGLALICKDKGWNNFYDQID